MGDPGAWAVPVAGRPIAGSGVLAMTMEDAPAAEKGGDITVLAPQGNISASSGGIVQNPLNGNQSLLPTVTLSAGTRDPLDPSHVIYVGNIDATGSGVIGVNTR